MKTIVGVRPVALKAVSERERLAACPHRAQAAVNHLQALRIARIAAEAETPAEVPAESPAETREEKPEERPTAAKKGRRK